ncbi:hypothetical protein [Psychromonas aquimarina]|uniref:hypothetical protein n=1 Tax=Psychromonas aquimarina TaxID=444919 RepID=UPI0004190C3A|nr:hypothetical protein [Psychromonas aquimarina]
MKKTAAALSLLISFGAFADSKPDPSDLTSTNSFASGIVSNDGEISVMGGIAGSYSPGNNFIGLLEHKSATKTSDDGRLAQDTRLRYFQVIDIDAGIMPQIGFSVDYMKSWKMSETNDQSAGSDIAALGAIAKIKTPWESFSLFPNIAYVQGKAEVGSADAELDLKGYQVNLFGSLAIGNSGDYLILQPQYMFLDAEARDGKSASGDVCTFKMKSGYGAPVDDAGKWWAELSHTYTRTDAQLFRFDGAQLTDNDHLFELAVSYYF